MLSDFLKSFAIVTLATAALASSVMATDGDMSASYKEETPGVLQIDNMPDALNGTYTLLVLKTDDGAVKSNIGESDIMHIDEAKYDVQNGSLTLNIKNLNPGDKYELRVGNVAPDTNDKTFRSFVFTAEPKKTQVDLTSQEGAREYFKNCTISLGNIDGSEKPTIDDVGDMAKMLATITFPSYEIVQASDVNNSGVVTVEDVTDLAKALTNPNDPIVTGSKTVANKTMFVTDYSGLIITDQN